MVDENWYGGREPGEIDYVRRVFPGPSSYVKIKTFLDPDFQATVPGYFPAKTGPVSFSEKADAENVVANIQLAKANQLLPYPLSITKLHRHTLGATSPTKDLVSFLLHSSPTNWLSWGTPSALMLSSSVSLTTHVSALFRSVSESSYQTTKLGLWCRQLAKVWWSYTELTWQTRV
ncbi:hypothetical protein EDB89DRAFT_1030853 [Lactarius sanguifluus]|nr:hypothetical protein EDB89DRAFT_1030853 [Lactarius sanguifluus]